jgi:heme exporter protein B
LLFLPVSVPLIIASVYATSKIVAGGGLAEITDYLTLMAVFDIVFFVLSSLVFDYIIEEYRACSTGESVKTADVYSFK